MNITLLDIAQALVAHDVERTCPFCTKHTWGAEQHDAGCPIDLAYRALQQAGTHALDRGGSESGVRDQALGDGHSVPVQRSHTVPGDALPNPWPPTPNPQSQTQGEPP